MPWYCQNYSSPLPTINFINAAHIKVASTQLCQRTFWADMYGRPVCPTPRQAKSKGGVGALGDREEGRHVLSSCPHERT